MKRQLEYYTTVPYAQTDMVSNLQKWVRALFDTVVRAVAFTFFFVTSAV